MHPYYFPCPRFWNDLPRIVMIRLLAIAALLCPLVATACTPRGPGAADVASTLGTAAGVGHTDAAELVVHHFHEYGCDQCAMVALETLPALRDRYAEGGRVAFVRIDLPADTGSSLRAALAVRCAGDQAADAAYGDLLHRRRAEWTRLESPDVRFGVYARTLGLDTAEFGACLSESRHDGAVRAGAAAAAALGIPRAPAFLVGAESVPDGEVAARIEERLGRP
jgi:protein-disulfide isomerase